MKQHVRPTEGNHTPNNGYFKHEIGSMNDSMLSELVEDEGAKGLGVYWAILEFLAGSPDYVCTIKALTNSMRRLKVRPKYLEQILAYKELFIIKNDTVFSPKLDSLMSAYSAKVEQNRIKMLEKQQWMEKNRKKRASKKENEAQAFEEEDEQTYEEEAQAFEEEAQAFEEEAQAFEEEDEQTYAEEDEQAYLYYMSEEDDAAQSNSKGKQTPMPAAAGAGGRGNNNHSEVGTAGCFDDNDDFADDNDDFADDGDDFADDGDDFADDSDDFADNSDDFADNSDDFAEDGEALSGEESEEAHVQTPSRQAQAKANKRKAHSAPTQRKPETAQSKSNLAQSKSNLTESKSNLSESNSKLNQANSETVQSKSEINQVSSNLNQSKSEINQVSSNLIQTNSKINQTNSNLIQSNSKINQTNSNLNQKKANLNQKKTNLIQSNSKNTLFEGSADASSGGDKSLNLNVLSGVYEKSDFDSLLIEENRIEKKRVDKNRREHTPIEHSKKNSASAENKKGGEGNALKSVKQKIIPAWEAFIDSAFRDQSWKELMAMRSGMKMDFMRYFDEILKYFKLHVRCFGGEETINSERSAKHYFSSFITQGSYTSKQLLKQLRSLKPKMAQLGLNPYRFEFRNPLTGERNYNGTPIPMNAPPRPSNEAMWDFQLNLWR